MVSEGRILRLILLIFVAIIISANVVVAPPPMPPVAPSQPTVQPSCSNTNEGIEICDSLDNDCDGFTDEEGCSATAPEDTGTTADSSSSSGSSSGSKKSGGGGSGGSSSGILFFSEPESSGTVVDKSTLPPDESSDGVDMTSPEYLESFAASQGTDSSAGSDVSNNQDSSSENNASSSYAAVLFSDYRNMIIGSTALLLIAGVIIFTVVRNNGFKKNPVPTDKQGLTVQEATAVKYIAQMRANKYTENDIKTSMKRAGWDDREVDKLMKK